MQVIEKWRVEPEELAQIVLQEIYSMGIYQVEPMMEKIMEKQVIELLQLSPEIQKLNCLEGKDLIVSLKAEKTSKNSVSIFFITGVIRNSIVGSS